MPIPKLFLFSVVIGFAMWSIAGLWHNIFLAKFYAREKHATHKGVGILLIAYLILGSFMAYLYPLVFQGGNPVWSGLKFGMLIGCLWVFPHELAMAGAHGESIFYVSKNAIWHMVEQGLGGIILGLMYAM